MASVTIVSRYAAADNREGAGARSVVTEFVSQVLREVAPSQLPSKNDFNQAEGFSCEKEIIADCRHLFCTCLDRFRSPRTDLSSTETEPVAGCRQPHPERNPVSGLTATGRNVTLGRTPGPAQVAPIVDDFDEALKLVQENYVDGAKLEYNPLSNRRSRECYVH
jgi:hypothetical protein